MIKHSPQGASLINHFSASKGTSLATRHITHQPRLHIISHINLPKGTSLINRFSTARSKEVLRATRSKAPVGYLHVYMSAARVSHAAGQVLDGSSTVSWFKLHASNFKLVDQPAMVVDLHGPGHARRAKLCNSTKKTRQTRCGICKYRVLRKPWMRPSQGLRWGGSRKQAGICELRITLLIRWTGTAARWTGTAARWTGVFSVGSCLHAGRGKVTQNLGAPTRTRKSSTSSPSGYYAP